MNKKSAVIIGLSAILVVLALVGISVWQGSQNSEHAGPTYQLAEIAPLTESIDYSGYDYTKVIPADANTGNIAENIKGDANAPVKIFEYADYQCEHCAALNPLLNQIYEEYDGKVAIVFRADIMSYHQNGVIAASAANAAGIQGYWPEYKDLLFGNQNEWFSMDTAEMPALLEDYFVTATKGQGDLEKFRSDMQSSAVAQKIAFDLGLSEDVVEVQWTPSIYVNDTFVSQKKDDDTGYTQGQFGDLIRARIDAALSAK